MPPKCIKYFDVQYLHNLKGVLIHNGRVKTNGYVTNKAILKIEGANLGALQETLKKAGHLRMYPNMHSNKLQFELYSEMCHVHVPSS